MKSPINMGLVLGTAALAGAGFGCSEASGSTAESQEAVAQVSQAVTSAGTDPGPRGGASAAGSFFSTLSAAEQALFATSLATFNEVDSVSGTIEAGSGLGPTFNGNSCAMCHAQPAAGGSS
ncbi:MAG TPA: hypothetical protein VK745_17980, partial [Polyangiaceae bacterium]|nr:hypothetical protein [Polyangiaceae bacterium]